MQENCFYHIYNRGNNKENIFLSDNNYSYLLRKFNKYLNNFIEVYAYCLMPNHFHFLIKIKENFIKNEGETFNTNLLPVEKAFRDFFITYVKAFNVLYSRTGSLFQYEFKRKIITDEKYFVRVIAYIHNNPVRKKLCENVSNWKYSSYNAILSSKSTNLKREEVLSFFENSKEEFIEYHKLYSTLTEDRDFLYKQAKDNKTTKV
jgi:putative transposase